MSLPSASTIRRHRRIALGSAAIAADVSLDGQPPVTGLITILGAGGAFVEGPSSVDVGSSVGIRFTLPDSYDQIICTGVVRDSVGGGIGIEFTEITSSERELVDIAVRRLERRAAPIQMP